MSERKKIYLENIEDGSFKSCIKTNLESVAMKSQPIFEQNGLKVEVFFVLDYNINASVCKSEEDNYKYNIYLYNGVIDTLKQSLEDKYLVNMKEEDFEFYQFMEADTYFRMFNDRTLKNSFMNCMAMFIFHNIFFHECGHILLGHCENNKFETREMMDYSGGKRSGYGHQTRELLADWYGMKQALTAYIYSFAKESTFSIKKDEDIFLLRKILVMCLFSAYCQFDLFEKSSQGYDYRLKISEYELKMRSHPHPYTRLLYCMDAIREGLMDIINVENDVTDDISEKFVNDLVVSAVEDLNGFLSQTDGEIFNKLRISTINEAYYQLRKCAWGKKKSNKSFINFQMEKLSEEYLKQVRNYVIRP